MPTYEYACTGCGQHVEVVQSMTDQPLRECGVCGGQLRKVFSPIGIVFKGSGFYRTDSRSAGSNDSGKPAAGSSSEEKASSSPGEQSSDTSGEKSSSSKSDSTAEKTA